MNFTALPRPVTASTIRMHARHHRDHQQPGQAVLGDDAGDDHDERAGRPADLDARSAEQRDDEAADDGGVDAGLRA